MKYGLLVQNAGMNKVSNEWLLPVMSNAILIILIQGVRNIMKVMLG